MFAPFPTTNDKASRSTGLLLAKMTASMRLNALQLRHRALDEQVADLQARPWSDQLLIQRLKKEKLRLKDVIERMKDDLIPDLDA